MSAPGRSPRFLLAGGGSGGSSTPLLAVAHELRRMRPEASVLYVGTAEGPERSLVEREGLPFAAVAAGKLRRYWSVANLTDPLRVLVGVVQSLAIARRFRPSLGFGAGGFASVPPLVGCWLHRVPIVIHQQDVEPGLANRLLAPLAARVSVSLEASLAHFPAGKVCLNGNPVRASVLAGDREAAIQHFGLEPGLPTVLVTGGGTGALGLNRLVAEGAGRLTEVCQLIHLTGRGRQVPVSQPSARYRAFEFLTDEMPLALAAADVVVSRAGLATLSELAALGKPVVLVPMPGSHQLANARAVADLGAALHLDQERLRPADLAGAVRELLAQPERLAGMAGAMRQAMPAGAAERIARQLLELAEGAI